MAYNIDRPIPTRKPLDLSGMRGMWPRDPVKLDGIQSMWGRDPIKLDGIKAMWDNATQVATDQQKVASPLSSTGVGSSLSKAFNSATPFMSNIINSFRKPPMPKKGEPFRYTPLQKVNLSDERNKISTMYQAANRNTERNVDSNTAEAIKAFNRGDEISKLTAVNERENNMNVGISNQQAQMDASTSVANTGLENKYRDELVERQVAQQREQSANWANAGDKLMMIHNERSKERTELGKARVLRSLYDKSGVLKRDNAMGQQWRTAGVPDPFGEDYKWLDEKKMSMGGRIPSRKLY